MKDNTTIISTTEIAERMIDALNDYQTDQLITGSQYRSKTQYRNVIRAINYADREVCMNIMPTHLVVVYLPANTSNIPFRNNNMNSGALQAALRSLDLDKFNKTFFVQKYDYLDILEINDKYINVFNEYPIGQEESSESLRLVGRADFFENVIEREGRYFPNYGLRGYRFVKDEKICAFIADENRLILADHYSDPKFIRFAARIMPGIMNVAGINQKCVDDRDYDQYRIVSPHYSMHYLQEEAIYQLLPKSSLDAKRVANVDRAEKKEEAISMKPTERTVVVPYRSFG